MINIKKIALLIALSLSQYIFAMQENNKEDTFYKALEENDVAAVKSLIRDCKKKS